MKGKKHPFVIFTFLILLVISLKIMGDTLARYAGITKGMDTLEIASWSFDEDNSDENIIINLLENVDSTKLINGKIAPGANGSFQIGLSNKNTDVTIEYNIAFDMNGVPSDLTITNPEISSGTLRHGEEKILTFNWKWDYEADEDKDIEDTTYIGKDLIIPITITGKQLINN